MRSYFRPSLTAQAISCQGERLGRAFKRGRSAPFPLASAPGQAASGATLFGGLIGTGTELNQTKAMTKGVGKSNAPRSSPFRAAAFTDGASGQRLLLCCFNIVSDEVQMDGCPMPRIGSGRACAMCGCGTRILFQQIDNAGSPPPALRHRFQGSEL